MEYRQLGTSDVHVSEIILGTWAIGGWMWGGTDDDAAIAAIRKSIDIGMTSIDTAPMYGFGHSEEVIGKAIEGRRDQVQLLTKYCLRWDLEEGTYYFDTKLPDGTPTKVHRNARKHSIMKEVEDSLRRLGTDYIDVYQCHWPDFSTPYEETMEAMDELLKQGKIRAAGVSNFDTEMMQRCLSVVHIASNQPPYSMLKREIENDVLPFCIQNNIGVIVYSPLQNGILSGRVTMDRSFPASDLRHSSPYYKPENRRRILEFLDRIRPIAEAHNATLAQLVINWTIHRPGVTAALVGARNPQQVKENAAAAELSVADEQVAQIDALLDELQLAV